MNDGGYQAEKHNRAIGVLVVLGVFLMLVVSVTAPTRSTPEGAALTDGVDADHPVDLALAYGAEDDRMLVRLYAAYFGRAPDQAGFEFWRRQLIGGADGEGISEAFARSTEFVNRYGKLTDGEFVSLVYRNVLGREAEADGFDYWLGELRAGESRGEVMLGFSESAEFTRLTNHIPTPDVSPLTSYELRGQTALEAIGYEWQAKLPGWTIEFLPARSGYYGLTYVSSKRIVIYVRPSQTDGHLAHVVAHEIGHAVDVSLNTPNERERWKAERAIDSTWWPGDGASDFQSGAGDFAESFAYWQVGHLSGQFHSRLAGLPDAGDRALMAELAAG